MGIRKREKKQNRGKRNSQKFRVEREMGMKILESQTGLQRRRFRRKVYSGVEGLDALAFSLLVVAADDDDEDDASVSSGAEASYWQCNQ